jgi:hypothetical protein
LNGTLDSLSGGGLSSDPFIKSFIVNADAGSTGEAPQTGIVRAAMAHVVISREVLRAASES